MALADKNLTRAFQGAPKLVIATVSLMEELARTMDSEIDIIRMRKKDEHAVLLRKKQRLAVDYRANMKALAADPGVLKALSDEGKAVLRNAAKRLADSADANALALRAAVGATRQLIQNIMAMVRSETSVRPAYKNPANAHMELGCYSPTCRPVAVSRTV